MVPNISTSSPHAGGKRKQLISRASLTSTITTNHGKRRPHKEKSREKDLGVSSELEEKTSQQHKQKQVKESFATAGAREQLEQKKQKKILGK